MMAVRTPETVAGESSPPDVAPVSAIYSIDPMSWREGWEPFDPLRPCYTCGSAPAGYFDRDRNEPRYACTHPAISDDDFALGHWSTRSTAEEREEAYVYAKRIGELDREHGVTGKFLPYGRTQLQMDLRGRLAEIVAARLTGLSLNRSIIKDRRQFSKKKPDLGRNVEVRNTVFHDGTLVVYENDPDDRLVLLVTGLDPFVLRGWSMVRHVRKRELYSPIQRKDRPTLARWSMAQSSLHPMPLPPGA